MRSTRLWRTDITRRSTTTLLGGCGLRAYVTTIRRTPSNCSRSLSCLDYRKLTDESLDPLVTLQPVLTSQNVLSISKLASRLPVPSSGGATVSPSAVHAVWLQKLFWKGDPQLLKRPPQSDQDYLHAYDTCAKYLDRLVPADAIRFLDNITFSPDAAENLSIQARSEVIKRATKAICASWLRRARREEATAAGSRKGRTQQG
ncbi:neuroblastoma-amplified sequence [Lates japonicus]|uniref:Neuroblastoma-amplified sequence n=1 Tax=Lates japonicus TaxID=270547 RepID=A0AAD3RLJ1_LATJO|nr:neuroblastoma-amplified sequence [Lates japonicus]